MNDTDFEPTKPPLSQSLEAFGWVIAVDERSAWVRTQRETGCSGCQSQQGCGTSSLAKLFSPENSTPLKVDNTLDAKVGDQVILSLKEQDLLKHSLMAYGFPLVGFFMGAIVVQALFSEALNEFPIVLGGFGGLLFGWWLTRTFYHPAQPILKSIIS